MHVVIFMHAFMHACMCMMETSTYVTLTYTLPPLCQECFEAAQRVIRHAC